MSLIVPKPWGSETIFTDKNLPYTGKILSIKSGKRLSLQYHDQKTETLTLISGQAKIIIDKSTFSMRTGEGYTILPKVVHRIEATTDTEIIEVSTPEAGTTFRLEDDYNRSDETFPLEISH